MPRGVYDSPKRGLASANPQTRQKVARLGGLVCAIRLGELYCEARAEKGGLAFVQKYGKQGLADVRLGKTIKK